MNNVLSNCAGFVVFKFKCKCKILVVIMHHNVLYTLLVNLMFISHLHRHYTNLKHFCRCVTHASLDYIVLRIPTLYKIQSRVTATILVRLEQNLEKFSNFVVSV